MDDFLASKKIKAAPPSTENAASNSLRIDNNKSLKWRTTLSHLLRGPRHRFQAEKWGDHALHSTVSTLSRNFGIVINREWRKVPTRFGKGCRVCAYWVNELSRNHAMRLVAKRKRKEDGGAE
jgi:hypothetical protein